MQPPPEARPAASALLTIRTADGAWGIPSASVVGIEPWSAASDAALDVLALLGSVPASPHETPRVVVLQVRGAELRLLVRGALALVETAASNLLPLPPALQRTTPLVSHVAVVDGKAALFVVSPERLQQACRRSSRPPSPPLNDSASR